MDHLIQLNELHNPVLNKLLMDKTTGKNIIWATDSYSDRGKGYQRDQQMLFEQVIKSGFLQPRILKSLDVQKERTKKNAEVYTPAWICNLMNNQIDQDWFDDKKGFNQQEDKNWIVNADHISFLNQDKKTWKEYVSRKVLEITCGEAPFLVSRYDSSTGNPINIQDRVGLFDRKLRVVTENTNNFEDWYKWALKALKSTYGYEFQGDSLLIGRVNVYLTLLENAKEIWKQDLTVKQQEQIADIICWNLFQMDGLTDCIPVGVPIDQFVQPSLFDFFETEQTNDGTTSPPVKINWWDKKAKMTIREMKEGIGMSKRKFSVVIGNPPYMEFSGENNKQAKPVYQKIIEQAQKLQPSIISMIIPSRWFAGGMGLDGFRDLMLKSGHVYKLIDFQNAKDCFSGLSISGGCCIFQMDNKIHSKCDYTHVSNGIRSSSMRKLDEYPVFVRSNAALEIIHKVWSYQSENLATICSSLMPFGLSTNVRGSIERGPNSLRLYSSNSITYIDKEIIKKGIEYISGYKVLVSKTSSEHANEPSKDGTFRVIPSSMKVIGPNEVCTHSYFLVGNYSEESEAKNLYKYLSTKFVRYLILQSVSSINLSKLTMGFVPLQDFTNNSDIDWSKSIPEIDQQLYKKYGLSPEEIEFIETHVKEME
ncbi:MAG: Eco57I restriction-modification methylase domain-containing protein [Erysipelotrichaceae bacterium]|nr:Eco57I restriction-modification methylase domain-containing protein [Erysipelotrichaceae bacterium]